MPRHAMPIVLVLCALSLSACNLQPPITVGQRESLVGQGIVLAVTNTSGDFLHEVTVTIESPDGEAKTFSTPTLEPHETLSVGWLKLEGWPIPPGSKVSVSCKGFLMSAGPWTVGS